MNNVFLSARHLADQIRREALSPVELIEGHLEKIDVFNPKVNALRFVNREQSLALAEARRTEIKEGRVRGRLHGIAFSAKDHFNIEGLPQSQGTLVDAIERCTTTAVVIQKLLNEGAICIGKANMAEYGKSYFTENDAFGRTNNPFDRARSPGGSSGGDAAAVASGFASFGIAADSGGSVRVPAGFCGLFGLYPTSGLVTGADMLRKRHTISKMFNCIGPITRTIDDLEMIFDIIRGVDDRDPFSVPAPRGRDVGTLFPSKRFAFFTEMNGVKCDPEIEASLKNVVKTLVDCGFHAEEHTPAPFEACYEMFIVLAGQTSLLIDDLIRQGTASTRSLENEGKLLKSLRQRLASELPPLSLETVLRFWHRADMLRYEAASIFHDYDFIVSPIAATLPPLHGTTQYEVGEQKLASQQVFQFASAANVLGLPALAFPTGLSKDKLPIGLQVIGPRFSERRLFAAVRATGRREGLTPELA